MLAPWKKSYDQPKQHIKKQRHYFASKDLSSQSYGFFSSHVWMWELDYIESWAPKNWCFWTVMLEKTLESPLDCKEIQPVYPKGDQSWVFIGRTDVEADSGRWWWTGKPGVLRFMGSQRVGHDWSDLAAVAAAARLVIAFPPRSKCLLISWLQSPSAEILEPPKNKVWHCFHYFPIYFPWRLS